ncbi:hypothetical protein MNV49_006118 [Pseudohyphozyma bogoriensis]|nr:hypothetical protein MNV49_006118 [Pseudohyphozyma bogoriensis]
MASSLVHGARRSVYTSAHSSAPRLLPSTAKLTHGGNIIKNLEERDQSLIEKLTNKRPTRAALKANVDGELAKLKGVAKRASLINLDLARDLVRAWGVDKLHDATVLDLYSGPGTIANALLELKNVKQVVAVENAARYLPFLERIQETDNRLKIHAVDPFTWEAYSEIEDAGVLKDVPIVPFERATHPNLFITGQLPANKFGEQLFVQLVSAAATGGKMWLYKYGRLQMGLTMENSFLDKISKPPGESGHAKLAVLLPTVAKFSEMKVDLPFNLNNFHSPRGNYEPVSVLVTPHTECRVKNFDALEYLARNMFIAKRSSWKKALAATTVGADNLIQPLLAKGIPDEARVMDLTQEQWVTIADTFDAWPFRPETLFDLGAFEALY